MAKRKSTNKSASRSRPAAGTHDPSWFEPFPLPDDRPAGIDDADALVDRAVFEDDETARDLAWRALEICPDCAGAYVLLGHLATELAEKERLFRQGIAAGERSLGRRFLDGFNGHLSDSPSAARRRPPGTARTFAAAGSMCQAGWPGCGP